MVTALEVLIIMYFDVVEDQGILISRVILLTLVNIISMMISL